MKRVVLACLVGIACLGFQAQADEKEAPAGFTSLFNGKDLTGWKNDSPEGAWTVADGTIHYDGSKAKNLVSGKNYKDFELLVDWKITKKGDSGIYLRGKPQVQIWDSENLAANLSDDAGKGSGGLWNNPKGAPGKQPSVSADKPVGEWNTFHIKMVGDKVTVKLNGKVVVDDAQMLAGKVPATGPVELQVHGTPLWFRNIYIRELHEDPK